MDFTIPEELADLRASFASFVDREVRPAEDSVRELLQEPGAGDERITEAGRKVVQRSAQEGFYAAHMPESAGGGGLSTLGMTLLVEDAARSGLRFAIGALAPPNPGGPNTMLLDVPEHLQDTYLYPVVRAEKTMCFALTEPEAGSDAQSIRTRAHRDGDEWVIEGHKHYITNADKADFAIVLAVTDPDKRANGGITAFIVPSDQYSVTKKQHTIADGGAPCEILIEGARVPGDHVIGEVGQGFFSAMKFLNAGRAYIGANCLGLAEYCLDQAVEHANVRTTFGKPIGKYQGVSFPLADSKVEIEAMRWLTYHLAWQVDAGEEAVLDASIVKYYNTERAYAIADRCLQTFGGMGLLKEGPIEGVLRQLRVMRVVEGASSIQQLLISRFLGL